ncbi:MAG: ParB N-terminal domain-containing protein [Candidatus Taylorbacteria bacterium]|nr:ParB N-terminal domain-containing protein [Candidatus Taylorbacteria bacterium]
MNKEEIPKIIRDVGFDFSWSEKKVWILEVPVEEINIDELTWHFDIPFLWERGIYNLKPQEVISNSDIHKKEYARTMKADLIHPIDIMENKGRWLILDGLHRLMKASILGMKTIKVRKIPRVDIPKIVK